MNSLQDLINRLGLQEKVSVEKADNSRVPASQESVESPVPMPKPSAQELDLKSRIKQYENPFKEGYDAKTGRWMPHKSPEGGAPTIAYGDKLFKGKYSPEEVRRIMTQGMTDEEVEQALDRNLQNARMQALDIIKEKQLNDLSPQQEEALTEMVFQMGKKGVKGFPKMLEALRQGDVDSAYNQALDSLWAKQTPQRAREVAERLKFPKVKRYIYKK